MVVRVSNFLALVAAILTMIQNVPYGALMLAAIYVSFVLIVKFTLPDCLHKPCNSEGFNNSTDGWATDLCVAMFMFAFSFHIWWKTRQKAHPADIYATWAHVYMGIAYIVGGIVHSMLPNNAFGDGKGLVGFWVVYPVAFISMAMSIHMQIKFVHAQRGVCAFIWARSLIQFLMTLLVIVAAAVTLSCVWCLATPSLHTSRIIDAYTGGETPLCVWSVLVFEGTFYTLFSAFWVPWALIMHAVTKSRSCILWGVRTEFAAILVPTLIWTIGLMLLPYTALLATSGVAGQSDVGALYEQWNIAVIYHFGMLLSSFFAFQVAYCTALHDVQNANIV